MNEREKRGQKQSMWNDNVHEQHVVT
jgi:hypothetical protein